MNPKKKQLRQINNFWIKVDCSLSINECWNWNSALTYKGYGWVRWNGYPTLAHRAVWMMVFGNIPTGLGVLHECDNRRCCNPFHLFLGTNLDNARDRASKGRNSPRHGEYSFTRKLSNDSVAEIRRLYFQEKNTQVKLAKKFNVSQAQVSKIIRNESWTRP